MFVRVVTLKSKEGKEEEVRQMGRHILVPLNKKAGCTDVYFLEPTTTDNLSFGVISMWGNQESLNEMKESKEYCALIQRMEPSLQSVTDCVYWTE